MLEWLLFWAAQEECDTHYVCDACYDYTDDPEGWLEIDDKYHLCPECQQ